jgi:hypothetical protein
MRSFFVEWSCWPLPARCLAGCISHAKGGGEPVRSPGKNITAFPQWGIAVGFVAAPNGYFGGVHNVHTFGFGLGRTCVGSGRFTHVFGTSQCFQGLEYGSSPTSGTVFSQVSGFLSLCCC